MDDATRKKLSELREMQKDQADNVSLLGILEEGRRILLDCGAEPRRRLELEGMIAECRRAIMAEADEEKVECPPRLVEKVKSIRRNLAAGGHSLEGERTLLEKERTIIMGWPEGRVRMEAIEKRLADIDAELGEEGGDVEPSPDEEKETEDAPIDSVLSLVDDFWRKRSSGELGPKVTLMTDHLQALIVALQRALRNAHQETGTATIEQHLEDLSYFEAQASHRRQMILRGLHAQTGILTRELAPLVTQKAAGEDTGGEEV